MISLEELIDFIISEPNVRPRDFCFRFSVSKYPEETHESFGFPGEYVRNLRVNGFDEKGGNLEMDCAQMVMPKGDITCKSTINVEHQTYPIKNKIDQIYKYKLALVGMYGLPSNSVVITNMNMKKGKICCESHDQIFYLSIIVADDDEISIRLNALDDKFKSSEKLSGVEILHFSYISIFVRKHHAKAIMEKLVYLFSKSTHMDEEFQLFLHTVLVKMIKFHFDGDENKIRELLTMITRPIYNENYEGLTLKEYAQMEIERLIVKNERSEILLNEMNCELDKKENEINEMADENLKLKLEIERLKKQLNE